MLSSLHAFLCLYHAFCEIDQGNVLSPCYARFLKFNNRILRKILIRDNRAESSIVSLYKKLELQSAMDILDSVSGDISAAPSILSLWYATLSLSLSRTPHFHIHTVLFSASIPVQVTREGEAKHGV